MTAMIRNALDALDLGGYVEVHSGREDAVAIFRAAQRVGFFDLGGGSFVDEWGGQVIYYITCDYPPCDRCGAEGGGASDSGMCYQCSCEAHAEGWYSHDLGKARGPLTDARIHAR